MEKEYYFRDKKLVERLVYLLNIEDKLNFLTPFDVHNNQSSIQLFDQEFIVLTIVNFIVNESSDNFIISSYSRDL